MEEGLLLHRVALHAAHIAPRHVESATPVETDFAHSRLTFRYWAAVPAGVTANPIAVQLLVQFGSCFPDALVENLSQGGHTNPYILAHKLQKQPRDSIPLGLLRERLFRFKKKKTLPQVCW